MCIVIVGWRDSAGCVCVSVRVCVRVCVCVSVLFTLNRCTRLAVNRTMFLCQVSAQSLAKVPSFVPSL